MTICDAERSVDIDELVDSPFTNTYMLVVAVYVFGRNIKLATPIAIAHTRGSAITKRRCFRKSCKSSSRVMIGLPFSFCE